MTELLLLGNQNPVQLYSLQFLTIICITVYYAVISVQCSSFPLPSSPRHNGSVACALWSFFLGQQRWKIHQVFKPILSGILDGATTGAGNVFRFLSGAFLKLLLFLWAPGQDPAYLISTCSNFRFILNICCQAQRFNYWASSQLLRHSWVLT